MKIIIIDDEKAMHLIMKRMLGKVAGVEVIASFQETAAAYAYLAGHAVDLIFIDINMPKESGLEFAERLREQGSTVKLVFVTSHKEYALHAFDVYAYDYIVKPVTLDRIKKTVQRLLSEKVSNNNQVEKVATLNRAEFICLGGIDIKSTDGAMVKWKSSKSAELFGYLLMNKGRRVSRSRLIEDIFEGMPQKNAEVYLNTTVYQLRKLLEKQGVKDHLQSDGTHYVLNLNEVRTDFIRFEEGCKRMAVIDEQQIEHALELEQLYSGELYGNFAFSWARSEIERFSLMYSTLAQKLCSALLNRGDTHTAIRLLKKLLAQNELEEESIKSLMKALAIQKNKEAITREYIHFAETLHREIGISPSTGVTILYKQLLAELEV